MEDRRAGRDAGGREDTRVWSFSSGVEDEIEGKFMRGKTVKISHDANKNDLDLWPHLDYQV
jgi:hypothetical protein